jgi:hypothetical protein
VSTLLRDHAPFPPSSIARIVQCPGSWQLCKQYPPDKTSEDALEGDAAHWVVAQWVKGSWPAVGDLAPNGVMVTEEMRDGAELWAYETGFEVGVEDHIEEAMPASELIDPDNWGTPDRWTYRPVQIPDSPFMGGVIKVSDYKFGHRIVEVVDCWQLMNYGYLILDALKMNGFQELHTKFEFCIVQPRGYHIDGPVRRWTVMAHDLRAERNNIRVAIIRAKSENATCHVGTECRDCSAKGHCGTLHRAALTEIDEVGRPTPMDLPPMALSNTLRMLRRSIDILKARESGLTEVALATIKGGTNVPSFNLRTGQGREVWKISAKEVQDMGDMMGGIVLTEPKAVTPKQAIKMGLDADTVRAFTETRNGETKLVEDDGRLARKAFGTK